MAFKVLESPHVTEKASELAEKNKYSFKVSKRSNKTEVKKAVEELYGVSVVNVAIINIHRKKKRVGRTMGFKNGYKKAIVEIKKGQSIEVMPR
ncbi:50S ribosomal protein L23 [Patescibacteria group bacterium]|nr:50S ribosomal protein L23 [Patescibacteria group bacterium]